MEKLVLVGGGPFAKCTINYIEDEEKYEIVGYTDLEDNGDILGYKYLGKDEEVLSKLFAEGVKYAVVGAGNHLNDCTIKEKITNKVKSYGFILPVIHGKYSVVQRGAIVEEGVILRNGAIIQAGAVVKAHAMIGDRVLVLQSPNQKIPDRKTKCVIKTHINIKQNVIFGAKLKPV